MPNKAEQATPNGRACLLTFAKTLRDCLAGHLRSKMDFFIMVMITNGMMTTDDLDAFSAEVRERALRRSSF